MTATEHLITNLQNKSLQLLTAELDEDAVDDYTQGYLAAQNNFKLWIEDCLEVYEFMKEREE